MFSTYSDHQPIGDDTGAESCSRQAGDSVRTEQLNALWREALTMWLCWSEGHDQLTAQMFEARGDSRQLADLMDQMEQLRWRAVEMTRELLDRPLAAVERQATNSAGPGPAVSLPGPWKVQASQSSSDALRKASAAAKSKLA